MTLLCRIVVAERAYPCPLNFENSEGILILYKNGCLLPEKIANRLFFGTLLQLFSTMAQIKYMVHHFIFFLRNRLQLSARQAALLVLIQSAAVLKSSLSALTGNDIST